MLVDLSPPDLSDVLREADRAAKRLRRLLRLPHHDVEDLRQDLLVDLIGRLPAYDRHRGTLGAFVGTVITHKSMRIAGRVRRENAVFGRCPESLDAPVAEVGGGTRGDSVPEDEGYSAHFGQGFDRFGVVERRIDVGRALARLGAKEAALSRALADYSPHEIAAAGLGGRSSVYRRVRALRMSFLSAGVTPA